MVDHEEIERGNPYSPPRAEAALPLPPRAGSFTVGPEHHVVEIFWCYWSGLEVYWVDGVEVLRTRVLLELRGSRQFDAGEHQVIIRVDFWPSWKILLRPWEWVTEAYVDGELAVKDVAPKFRAKWRPLFVVVRNAFLFMLVLFGVVTALALLLFGSS